MFLILLLSRFGFWGFFCLFVCFGQEHEVMIIISLFIMLMVVCG